MIKSIVWKRFQHHPPILPSIADHFHITPFMNTSNSVLKLVSWGEVISLSCCQAVQGPHAFENLISSSSWTQTSVHPQTLIGEQVPHVLFRHRKAFPFHFLKTLARYWALVTQKIKLDGQPGIHIFPERMVPPHANIISLLRQWEKWI